MRHSGLAIGLGVFIIAGCGGGGGDGGGGGTVTPPPAPAKTISVSCSPSTGSLTQGQTYTVTAVATPANNATISGVSVAVNGSSVGSGSGPSYTTTPIATPAAGTHSIACSATSPDATVTDGNASVTVLAKPDSADIDYTIVNPWNETLTGETFTATLDGGAVLTSANGHLKGRVPVTATFTLTSANSFDAKKIVTPVSALTAATDTLEGVYDGKPKATLHFKANATATGTITAHLNNTTRHPTKETYDPFLHIFGCRNSSGRLNPNYNYANGIDTTVIFYEKIDPAQGERFNANKVVEVFVEDKAPVSPPWTESYQAPTATQLQGMDDAVRAWDAILSPLGMKLNLNHGEAPTQSRLAGASYLAPRPGYAQLGIDNGIAGSINYGYSSRELKQGGSLLVVSNYAHVDRGWTALSSAKVSAMDELGDGLISKCLQGEDPFNRDFAFVDAPKGVPDQQDIDYVTVRFRITGPLIMKNELEFEKTGTRPWPQKILLGKDTSPWTIYETYTASDGKPALRPVYRP